MHTRLLYITDKAKSAAEATAIAENWLDHFTPVDQAYDDEGNLLDEYATPAFFDWYTIGGRWNNELIFANLDDRRLVDLFENSAYDMNNNSYKYSNKETFSLFFPNANNPAWPNETTGWPASAMLITENIYNNLILKLKEQYVDYYFEFENECFYEDIDIHSIPKADLIGKAYAVVIDYHS